MALPGRRPPPLLMLAAGGLVVVLALGVLLVASRSGDRETADDNAMAAPVRAEATAGVNERAANAKGANATAASKITPSAITPSPSASASSAGRAPAEPTEPPPEELPIWARPPRVTVQPFPEGGRINPPMPPIKIPPEMLVPLPGAVDAATVTIP